MFKYKVNSRLLPHLRDQRERSTILERQGSFSVELSTHRISESEDAGISYEPELTFYPLFRNCSSRRKYARVSQVVVEPVNQPIAEHLPQQSINDPTTNITIPKDKFKKKTNTDSELQINVELDFGWLFGWLERIVWATMFVGIVWSLAWDFSKATGEYCLREGNSKHYPFNVLPSLSRSMSSFRMGKFLWTISMAAVFVARLLSNHFLHRLYESWYANNWFNKIFLGLAYFLDSLEIISLIMIPAFSLDCDAEEHSFFFRLFVCLTFTAEILQYLTRFLKRKERIELFTQDISNYYKQLGILILLQLFFIGFMAVGYILHDFLCNDFYYSIFTLGEYITVVINVRFKRDTVLFVK